MAGSTTYEASSFGVLLKQYRLAAGLTHERLAERAALSARAISDLERGISRTPRPETIRLLADALHLTSEQRAAFELAARTAGVPATPAAPISPAARAASQYADQAADSGTRALAGAAGERSGPLFDIRYARRADGAQTAYGVMGAGPALLVPPGFLSDLEWYAIGRDTAAFLRPLAACRTVILYDRHGCGLSDRGRTDFTAEDDMRDIEAVTQAIGATAFDLLGISWGALPALTFAARHPQRVRRLVLYGAAGLASRQIVERQAALAALRRADLDLYVRAVAMRAFPSGTDEENFRSFVQIHRMAASVETQERLEEVQFGVQDVLAHINAPTLILHRRDDRMAPFENGQHYARYIPGARFIPLDGDAHFPWVGDWQSVVTPILDFLLDDETGNGAG